MALEIKLLDLIDIELDSSFLVLARNMGQTAKVKTWGVLILGSSAPILIDTGSVNAEIMGRLGMVGHVSEQQRLEHQLGLYGVKLTDVRYVLHTHTHIDHAGQDHLFPMTTPVVMNRRELEYSASGLMGEQYPAEYVKHHIDRLHAPGGLRLEDLAESGPIELVPGVVLEHAGGHTEGSMNVLVETAAGRVCVCGDVIYDVQDQVVGPLYQVNELEPMSTGNHGMSKRDEHAAIKRAINSGDFVVPIHDYPARIEAGRVVARLGTSIPGPEVAVEQLLPSVTGAPVHEVDAGPDRTRSPLA